MRLHAFVQVPPEQYRPQAAGGQDTAAAPPQSEAGAQPEFNAPALPVKLLYTGERRLLLGPKGP